MANPYFMKALLGGLSEHLNDSYKEQAKRNADAEAEDRSVFEAMLKTDNPELQSLGLTGLMEKRGKGWFGKLKESKVKPQVDAILQRAKYASTVVPQAADAAQADTPTPSDVSLPKPAAGAPASEPSPVAQADTAPATGGGMTLTPGVSAPPSPSYSMSDPTSTGGMEPIEDVQARLGAPPAAPPSMSPPPSPSYRDLVEQRRSQFHAREPLGQFQLSPFEERQLQAQAAGLSPEETRQGMRSELFPHQATAEASMQRLLANIQGKQDTEAAKHKPYILQGVEADAAGLPEGTPIDRELFLKLYHEGHADSRAALSAAARKYAADRSADSAVVQVRTIDDDGVPIRRVIPRSQAAGQSFEEPAPVNAQNKAHQARVIIQRGEELKRQIQDNPNMGPILGRIARGEIEIGSVSPDVRALYTSLESFADLQPALHGARGIGYAQRFSHAIGGLETNPEAVIASINELQKTAQDFQNEVKPRSAAGGGPPAKLGAGATGAATAPPVPPIGQREVGKAYALKNGKIGTWTGVGFKEVQ